MRKKILLSSIIVIGCALIAGGIFFFLHYKKVHAGIVMSCGDVKLTVEHSLMDLAKPADIPRLDQYGCYENSDGCACAKVDSNGNPVIFGINGTNNIGVPIPTNSDEQKKFLLSLGELMMANAKASTTVTSQAGSFRKLPTQVMTSTLQDGANEPEARDVFFIQNGKLYDVTLQTASVTFARHWDEIEQSLKTLVFVK